MGNSTIFSIVFAVFGISHAWAAGDPASSTQNPLSTGLALGLAIAYLSRRRKIGGWLLYYYLQLLSTVAVTLLLLPKTLVLLVPAQWDSTNLYVWYLASTVPTLLATIVETGWGFFLLVRRNEANVKVLRTVLMVLSLSSAAAFAIDLKYFDNMATLFMDALATLFAAIWSFYFGRSSRVQLVFVEQRWDYERQQSEKVPISPQELCYVRLRALLVGGITFMMLLLMWGSELGDKKPDAGIFYLPLFYAAIAAAVGRYLPIRQKKRAALLAS